MKPPIFLSTLARFLFCHILSRVSTDVKCRERHVALMLSRAGTETLPEEDRAPRRVGEQAAHLDLSQLRVYS